MLQGFIISPCAGKGSVQRALTDSHHFSVETKAPCCFIQQEVFNQLQRATGTRCLPDDLFTAACCQDFFLRTIHILDCFFFVMLCFLDILWPSIVIYMFVDLFLIFTLTFVSYFSRIDFPTLKNKLCAVIFISFG